jgi:hypothetical protein
MLSRRSRRVLGLITGSLGQGASSSQLFLILNLTFLNSQPTPLDALVFAYLHCILHSSDTIRIEVTRRVNLVAWEFRVRCLVREGFVL